MADQELAGSGVLVVQDSALEVGKEVVQGRAAESLSSDPTEVNTTNREGSDTEHKSALEALHQGSEI